MAGTSFSLLLPCPLLSFRILRGDAIIIHLITAVRWLESLCTRQENFDRHFHIDILTLPLLDSIPCAPVRASANDFVCVARRRRTILSWYMTRDGVSALGLWALTSLTSLFIQPLPSSLWAGACKFSKALAPKLDNACIVHLFQTEWCLPQVIFLPSPLSLNRRNHIPDSQREPFHCQGNFKIRSQVTRDQESAQESPGPPFCFLFPLPF